MIEIERIEKDLFISSNLFFRDDGPIKPGAKTRQFSVYSRSNKSLLGYVKWYNRWKQYCFYPLNSLFDKRCLRQVAQFCEEATTAHMSRLPNKQRLVDMEKERRARKIERIAKKKLTKQESNGSIDLVAEVPDPENQVVEGNQNSDAPNVVNGE